MLMRPLWRSDRAAPIAYDAGAASRSDGKSTPNPATGVSLQRLALVPKQRPKRRLAGAALGFALLGHAPPGLGKLGFLLGAEAVVDARALRLLMPAALLVLLRMALRLALALLGAALLALLALPRLLLLLPLPR
jgi:hypothetical protein